MKDRIFEIAEAGLKTTEERVQNMMLDMVNAKTPGYLKRDIVIRSFPLELEQAEKKMSAKFIAMQPQVEGRYTNTLMGPLQNTGNDLDFAIGGDGFFVVLTPYGEAYTRDGRFYIDKEGNVLSVSGNFPLISSNGAIVLPPGAQVVVSPSGEIKVDDQVIGKIRVVKSGNPHALGTTNGVLFRDAEGMAELEDVDVPRVIQGYVESSNVNTVDTMMESIILSRLNNIDTKLIQTRDAGLGRALELGRPAQ